MDGLMSKPNPTPCEETPDAVSSEDLGDIYHTHDDFVGDNVNEVTFDMSSGKVKDIRNYNDNELDHRIKNVLRSYVDVDDRYAKLLQLVEEGVSVRGMGECDRTSVMMAVHRSCDLNIVKLLHKHRASVHGKDVFGCTPIMLAIKQCKTEVIKFLIMKGSSVMGHDQYGSIPIILACAHNCNMEMFDLLHKANASMDFLLIDALFTTYMTSGVPCDRSIAFLEEHCAGITRETDQGNHLSAAAFQYVRCPVENIQGFYDWLQLNKEKHTQFSSINLKDVANVLDRFRQTALIRECSSGEHTNIDCIKYLLSVGVSVNHTDQDGFTALMWLIHMTRSNAKGSFSDVEDMKRRTIDVIGWFISEAYKEDGLVSLKDIGYQNEYGLTALMLACYVANEKAVRILSQVTGVNTSEALTGQTALHAIIAVDGRYEKMYLPDDTPQILMDSHLSIVKKMVPYFETKGKAIIQTLVELKADVNARDHAGRTPFYLACCIGDMQSARILHAAGADVNITNHAGVHPFTAACEYAQIDVVQTLINEGFYDEKKICDIRDDAGNSPFLVAARMTNCEIMKILINFGCDMDHYNKSGITALMTICETSGDAYMDSEVDDDNTRLACLQLLLEHKVDPNKQDLQLQTSLHIACRHGRTTMAEKLLQCHSDPNIKDIYGNTPLHTSIEYGTKGCAMILIRHMKNLEMTNNLHLSPLHTLCLKPFINHEMREVLEALLSENADVNSEDITKTTPLFFLCRKHSLPLAELLVQHGGDIMRDDCVGRGILHAIATTAKPPEMKPHIKINTLSQTERKEEDIFSWLVSKGLDVNHQDLFGLTPLHLACSSGRDEAARFFISNGADVHMADKNFVIPLALATQHPKTFQAVVDGYTASNNTDIALLNDLNDFEMVRNFATHHGTLSSITEILCTKQSPKHKVFGFNHDTESNPIVSSQIRHTESEDSACIDNGGYRLGYTSRCKVEPLTVNQMADLLTCYGKKVPYRKQKMLEQFMTKFAGILSQKHPAMTCKALLAGSVREGTKVISPDEFDFIFELALKHIQINRHGHSRRVTCSNTPFGKVNMTCRQCASLDNDTTLDRDSLVSHFYEASAEVFADSSLWNLFPKIYRLSTNDITGANRSISTLEIAIHSEDHPWFKVSIDMVPALHSSNLPSHCKIPEFLKPVGCRAVAKWFCGEPDNTKLFRLSFCLYDFQIFDEMPVVLKDALKLAKIVVHDDFCPKLKNGYMLRGSQLIDSHILKQCILRIYLYTRDPGDNEMPIKFATEKVEAIRLKDTQPNAMTDNRIEDVIYWANQIYCLLLVAMETKPRPFLESIYIPGHNILEDDKFGQFQDIAVEYVRVLINMISAKEEIEDVDCGN